MDKQRVRSRKIIWMSLRHLDEQQKEYEEANALRVQIFSRVKLRPEMTGEKAYQIIKELSDECLSELRDDLKAVLAAEEEMRQRILKRASVEKALSEEQIEETKVFLAPLTLAELEIVEDEIFDPDSVFKYDESFEVKDPSEQEESQEESQEDSISRVRRLIFERICEDNELTEEQEEETKLFLASLTAKELKQVTAEIFDTEEGISEEEVAWSEE